MVTFLISKALSFQTFRLIRLNILFENNFLNLHDLKNKYDRYQQHH